MPQLKPELRKVLEVSEQIAVLLGGLATRAERIAAINIATELVPGDGSMPITARELEAEPELSRMIIDGPDDATASTLTGLR